MFALEVWSQRCLVRFIGFMRGGILMTHVSVSDAGLRYSPFSGRVSIYLFGRPLDWSLAGDDAADVQNRLSVIARELGVKNILAPRPVDFNASVCTIRSEEHTS